MTGEEGRAQPNLVVSWLGLLLSFIWVLNFLTTGIILTITFITVCNECMSRILNDMKV